MLSAFLCVFLIGEFHQECQPAPSLVRDGDNPGEERDPFPHETDTLHPEFINYIEAS